MKTLHEEIRNHIHSNACTRVNEFIINIKIHQIDISEKSAVRHAMIMEARRRRPEPSWQDMIDLLTEI